MEVKQWFRSFTITVLSFFCNGSESNWTLLNLSEPSSTLKPQTLEPNQPKFPASPSKIWFFSLEVISDPDLEGYLSKCLVSKLCTLLFFIFCTDVKLWIPKTCFGLFQDVIETHPGLSFLQEAPEFHSRYVKTVSFFIVHMIQWLILYHNIPICGLWSNSYPQHSFLVCNRVNLSLLPCLSGYFTNFLHH